MNMFVIPAIIVVGIAVFGTETFATDYKIGVVFYINDADYGLNDKDFEAKYKGLLEQVRTEIASGVPYRKNCNDTLQLVVQTEIPWNKTETTEGSYNFTKFKLLMPRLFFSENIAEKRTADQRGKNADGNFAGKHGSCNRICG